MTPQEAIPFIVSALAEDVGNGDHSALSCIDAAATASAQLIVKDDGVLAGVAVAQWVCDVVDPDLRFESLIADGAKVAFGDIAFRLHGKAHSILKAERLLLNFMQRMSGIATTTFGYTQLIHDLPVKLLDTRKTTPGIRAFEKWAVRLGGGYNHRFGLYDMIMLKDNHVDYAGGIEAAIVAASNYVAVHQLNIKIEVETRTIEEVKQAISTGLVDRIMLDNFSVEACHEAVKLIGGSVETEASGGITKDTLRAYALTGVTYISVGALTHSVKSLDLSLKALR
jgi:nicotinate-nucleotide pyrophosphorylase (carboxylating)